MRAYRSARTLISKELTRVTALRDPRISGTLIVRSIRSHSTRILRTVEFFRRPPVRFIIALSQMGATVSLNPIRPVRRGRSNRRDRALFSAAVINPPAGCCLLAHLLTPARVLPRAFSDSSDRRVCRRATSHRGDTYTQEGPALPSAPIDPPKPRYF